MVVKLRSSRRPGLHDRPLTAASPGAADAVAALGRALDVPAGDDQVLRIERQRLVGRSEIYVIASTVPVQGRTRWLVKHPHTEWSQGDLAGPIAADREFCTLVRLHTLLGEASETSVTPRSRVPTPVALLPETASLVMEYVPGRTLRQLLTYRDLFRPSSLLAGLAAAGELLRQLHALEPMPAVEVDLRDEALRTVSLAEERLRPLGLALPEEVERTLKAFPSTPVSAPQVRLHGDFGPGNVLLAEDGSTVALDLVFEDVGQPEADLARFVAVMSGSIRFAPEGWGSPGSRVRRRLTEQLVSRYYGSSTYPTRFDLHLLQQLTTRWGRLRELAEQNQARVLLPGRLRVIGWQMHALMLESSRRLPSG